MLINLVIFFLLAKIMFSLVKQNQEWHVRDSIEE